MIAKQDVLDSMIRECKHCLYLFNKLPKTAYAYQPSATQRTTQELLRYLSVCGIATAESMAAGNWTPYETHVSRTKDMSPTEFPAAMLLQMKMLGGFFAELTDGDLQNKKFTTPWGDQLSLGRALMEMPLKFLTAYRMQLFLYAKHFVPDLKTMDCWAGAEQLDGKTMPQRTA